MLKFQVAFDEADSEGIVFFGNYFRLAHRALEAWLPTIGITWKEWFANSEWGVPLRHVEAEYFKPLRPGDEFQARLWVKEIGQSSIHFGYEFVSLEGVTLARLKTSHVCVSRPDMKKHLIPNSIRQRLTKHLGPS